MKEQTKLARMRFIELTGITPKYFSTMSGSMKEYYRVEVLATDTYDKIKRNVTNSILSGYNICGIKIEYVHVFRGESSLNIKREYLDNPTPNIKD